VRALLGFAVAIWVTGCASAAAPVAVTPSPSSSAASSSAAPPSAPLAATDSHVLGRASVKGIVSQGLGAFLQQVDLDDQPALVGGKFRGFRIAGLRGGRFWSGVDLRPGDVVTGINGLPIERPEQAQAAFDSLALASELRVAYDRDGQARELVYKIVDGL
jgi:type II secretory pathway component PulC